MDFIIEFWVVFGISLFILWLICKLLEWVCDVAIDTIDEKANKQVEKEIEYACSVPITNDEFETLLNIAISQQMPSNLEYEDDFKELCDENHIVFKSLKDRESEFESYLNESREKDYNWIRCNIIDGGKKSLMRSICWHVPCFMYDVEMADEEGRQIAELLCRCFPDMADKARGTY